MNRASRREAMFRDDDACIQFLSILATLPATFGLRIHGYALMPNHFHVMVESPHGNLSDAMQVLSSSFTLAYNRSRGHDGSIFRGRFRNEVVQNDAYWMHLLAYLHINPVKAYLAKTPSDCEWTSHNAYMDPARRPDWLVCDELLSAFGSAAGLGFYMDEVQRRRRRAPEGFEPSKFWSKKDSSPAPSYERPPAREVADALTDVASVLGVPTEQLLDRPRGQRGNRGAWLAAWWLLKATSLGQARVGLALGVSRSRISQLVRSLYAACREDRQLSDAMSALELMDGRAVLGPGSTLTEKI